MGEAILRAMSGDAEVESRIDGFRDRLLEWHGERPVSRPWRSASDPWHVLIGELSLRRAPADVVAAMYRRLVSVARSPRVVARDPEAGLEALRAIGLKTAAEAVVEIAVEVVERFDGKLPEDSLELRSLPGVGDYLAEAVRCFGFDRPSVLIDSSTSRICTRISGREEGRRFQLRLDLYALAGPTGPDAPFNRALLELGDEVCRTRKPRCAECPVSGFCARAAAEPVLVPEREEALAV